MSKIIFAKLKIISNDINNIISNHRKFYIFDKYNKLNILHKEYSEEYIKIINEQIYIKDLLKDDRNINNVDIKGLLQKVKEIEHFLYIHNEGKQLLY